MLHTEARGYLNEITNIAAQGWDDVYDIDDSIRWKEYIAMHAQWRDIIGHGIIAAQLEKFTTHGIRIDKTSHALTMSSTGRTTRFAECIRAPNAKTMHTYTSMIRAHATEQCKSTKLHQTR